MPGTYRTLSAWQRADDLFLTVHSVTKAFPRDERFELTSQIRRAALSVPTNIVEGTTRFNAREQLQFLRIAWASLAELEYLLTVAHRLHYVPEERLGQIEIEIARAAATLRGLIANRTDQFTR